MWSRSSEMSRRVNARSEWYGCVPSEFIIAYPQPPYAPSSCRRTSGKATRRSPDGDKHIFDRWSQQPKSVHIGALAANPLLSRKNSKMRQHLGVPLLSSRSRSAFNRTSTWRKLQANITPVQYDRIQQFQYDRRRSPVPRPTMLAPCSKHVAADGSVASSLSLLEAGDHNRSENKTYSLDHSDVDRPAAISSSVLSLQRNDDLEQFESLSASVFLDDLLLSSLLSPVTIPPPLPPTNTQLYLVQSHQPQLTSNDAPSIEELCSLIRTLLSRQLTEAKLHSVEAMITAQLAMLLTYLASPNHNRIVTDALKKQTTDRATCTDEVQPLSTMTVATQTDQECMSQCTPHVVPSHSDVKSASGRRIDLLSNRLHRFLAVTLHLPGRRLHRSLSDAVLSRPHRSAASNHRIFSLSETLLHRYPRSFVAKGGQQRLLRCIGQKLQRYVELESSNTCLEASTEFTPDFVLTATNNSKYENDDQTEQFGLDIATQHVSEIGLPGNRRHTFVLIFKSIVQIDKILCPSVDPIRKATNSPKVPSGTSTASLSTARRQCR